MRLSAQIMPRGFIDDLMNKLQIQHHFPGLDLLDSHAGHGRPLLDHGAGVVGSDADRRAEREARPNTQIKEKSNVLRIFFRNNMEQYALNLYNSINLICISLIFTVGCADVYRYGILKYSI